MPFTLAVVFIGLDCLRSNNRGESWPQMVWTVIWVQGRLRSEKRYQWSVPSWKFREQNLPMGLIIRPRFWEINQTNEVQWSERGATLAPQRKEMAHLKINVSWPLGLFRVFWCHISIHSFILTALLCSRKPGADCKKLGRLQENPQALQTCDFELVYKIK